MLGDQVAITLISSMTALLTIVLTGLVARLNRQSTKQAVKLENVRQEVNGKAELLASKNDEVVEKLTAEIRILKDVIDQLHNR